jgi:hypothetical protein
MAIRVPVVQFSYSSVFLPDLRIDDIGAAIFSP